MPKVISFSGSDRVGRHVAAVAAGLFKRTILELSGNSALVVLEDADLDHAVRAAVYSRFLFQGQVSMAANRILVDRSVEEEFTGRFTAAVSALVSGDPATPPPASGRSSTRSRPRRSPRWSTGPSRPVPPRSCGAAHAATSSSRPY